MRYGLLREHRPRRRARAARRGRRNHERDPGIPAGRPVLGTEFSIALKVEIALHVSDREDEAELRADAEDLGLEASDAVAGAAIATELFVHVADHAEHEFLGHEPRCGPIEVHVDAVLILRGLIFQIVGEAEHCREFMSRLRVEIGVAGTGVDCAVADADIRQAGGVVGADGHVSGDVGHHIVHAVVPTQRGHREEVPEAPHRIVDAVGPREWKAAEWRHRNRAVQRPRQVRAYAAV